MCGIAGAHGPLPLDERRRMLERLTHRGPDDEGEVAVNGSWLGHKRLSIVDVETGHQPLEREDMRMWLVGNGEVYNHQDVRGELDDAPYHTKSDNEVALHLLAERGPDALSELEGMFAFLAASVDGTFIAARDPVGIKPLYWTPPDGEGNAVFASEMRSFDPDLQPKVETFPPGHYWTPGGGLKRFASAAPTDDPHEGDPDATREVLVESVRRQLMGDVPVGVFLSGGLDSTLVAAIAAKIYAEHGEQLKTFAVGLEDSADLKAARAAAEYLGTEHHERIYDAQEAIDALPGVVAAIEHFDPSLVRSAVPNYLLAEMTAKHVKVVLTGEGADELFAGYEYLREFQDPEALDEEIARILHSLHDLNLQRADRVTMAHGLEARVPFLDREVIRFALRLPAEAKVSPPGQREKKLLRDAFTGWLPDELLWREKQQFGDGSGASLVLRETMAATVSEEDLEAEKDQVEPPLRDREELAYFRIFRATLPGISPEKTISRFATT